MIMYIPIRVGVRCVVPTGMLLLCFLDLYIMNEIYAINSINSMIPSILLIWLPVYMNSNSKRLEPKSIGKSCLRDSFVMSILYIMAVRPITANRLNILLHNKEASAAFPK